MAEPYRFREFYISGHMMESINLYVEHGAKPGSFLTSVICNDLKLTVMNADDINISNIPAFVEYFYNHTPASCWGSEDKMKAWIESFKEV